MHVRVHTHVHMGGQKGCNGNEREGRRRGGVSPIIRNSFLSFLFPSLFTGRMSKGSYSTLHVNSCSSKCWGKGVCACESAIHISTVTDLIQQQL